MPDLFLTLLLILMFIDGTMKNEYNELNIYLSMTNIRNIQHKKIE